MTKIWELDQGGIWNKSSNLWTENVVMTNNRLHSRKLPRLANRCIVFVADEEQRFRLQGEFIDNRLIEDHVDDLSLVEGACESLAAMVYTQ
jgi:hypothetical protein